MTRRPTAAAGQKPAAADPTGPPVDDQSDPVTHDNFNIRINDRKTQNANWVMRGTMDNKTLLESQGLFDKPHKALEEKFPILLESSHLATPGTSMQPMLSERNGHLAVTPLGALALASGANSTRSPDPNIHLLDGGIYLPGPSFTERLGWAPSVPFDLREVKTLATTDPAALHFLTQYNAARGPDWGGWTSVAHLGLLSIDEEAITSLMTLHLRSMYDPHFQPPSAFRAEIKQLAKQDKSGARNTSSPDDWMHPRARRMMRLFKGS